MVSEHDELIDLFRECHESQRESQINRLVLLAGGIVAEQLPIRVVQPEQHVDAVVPQATLALSHTDCTARERETGKSGACRRTVAIASHHQHSHVHRSLYTSNPTSTNDRMASACW